MLTDSWLQKLRELKKELLKCFPFFKSEFFLKFPLWLRFVIYLRQLAVCLWNPLSWEHFHCYEYGKLSQSLLVLLEAFHIDRKHSVYSIFKLNWFNFNLDKQCFWNNSKITTRAHSKQNRFNSPKESICFPTSGFRGLRIDTEPATFPRDKPAWLTQLIYTTDNCESFKCL